jgi:hypothetical protein
MARNCHVFILFSYNTYFFNRKKRSIVIALSFADDQRRFGERRQQLFVDVRRVSTGSSGHDVHGCHDNCKPATGEDLYIEK